MKIQELLQNIESISNKYDLINQKTGGYFNIFEITNIASDEVITCKILYELLSPNGSHYQGDLYLKTFIKAVLNIEICDDELSSAKVYKEYVIENNRRIDLVIQTKDKFIPIEVKIYAGEQKNQCLDYYKVAKNSNVYYLTRFGDLPSSYSSGGLEKEITAISFERDILNWLDICLSEKETIKIAPIREVILQLSCAISKFTNRMENEKEMEIKDILMKSSENMRSAIAIQESVNQCKCDLMSKLFKAIEKRVDYKKLENEYDYKYDNYSKIHRFYDKKISTWPGISYLYKEGVESNIDIWVRLEIDNRLFVGYCTAKDGKSSTQGLSQKKINELFKNVQANENSWWIDYEYILEHGTNDVVNFKNHNEALLHLFDDDKFNSLVDKCAEKINSFLADKH